MVLEYNFYFFFFKLVFTGVSQVYLKQMKEVFPWQKKVEQVASNNNVMNYIDLNRSEVEVQGFAVVGHSRIPLKLLLIYCMV